ncbi:MAG: hypothetical protein ACI9L9_000290 [Marivirga sp.]|jgi:hypothetical protein
MSIKQKCNTIVFSFLFIPFIVSAQNSGIKAEIITEKVTDYFDLFPTERMYLDIDKSSYVSGDTIWFKSYVTAGFYNQPSPLSGVGYVNLISSSDSIISSAKIKVDMGSGEGFINIPRELKSSIYQLVGYTKWILDVDSSEIFHKNIGIVNLFDDSRKEEQNTDIDLSITFFPEGGNIVNGWNNRVAFKHNGILADEDTLALFSDKGDKIATLNNIYNGMGTFEVSVEEDEKYYVKAASSNDKFYVPDGFNDKAGVLLVNLENLSDLRFKIYKGSELALDKVVILMHVNGLVTFAADADFSPDGTIIGKIAKELLGPGVNNLTVFSSMGIPILERSVFIDKEATFDLTAAFDQSVYSNRQEVNAVINASLQDVGLAANLSMSVVKSNQSWDVKSEDNIISYFLLSSRLKGKIQSPWYYFNSIDKQRYRNADLLMMVNGWSRYDFQSYLNVSLESIKPEAVIEQGLSISGYLTNEAGRRPIKNGFINYIVQDSSSAFGVARTDDEGYFNIPSFDVSGETSVVLKGKNEKGNDNVKFSIDSTEIESFTYSKFDNSRLDIGLRIDKNDLANSLKLQETLKGLTMESNFEMLEEVSVRSFKVTDQQKVNNIFGKGDYTLKTDELVISETALHVLELVRGRVPGVRVMGGLNSWSIMIGGIGSINSGTDPIILVDNVEVNIEYLNTLSPQQVEQIEVYKGASAAIFGVRGSNGALAFFTKNGVPEFKQYDLESIEVVLLDGYQEHKEFYEQKYDLLSNANVADYRTVLHWKASIQTDENGNYSTSFYSSDVDGKYVLVVEGITKAGVLGFYTIPFNVK